MLRKPSNYDNCDFCTKEGKPVKAVVYIQGPYGCSECGQDIGFCEEHLHKLVNALYDWKVEQDKKKEV